MQNQFGIAQFEGSPTGDTDESSEGIEGSIEESDGDSDEDVGENGDEDGDGDVDGDGDGDGDIEDLCGEPLADIWQSIVDYFEICKKSKKPLRIAVLSRIEPNSL